MELLLQRRRLQCLLATNRLLLSGCLMCMPIEVISIAVAVSIIIEVTVEVVIEVVVEVVIVIRIVECERAAIEIVVGLMCRSGRNGGRWCIRRVRCGR